MVAGCSHAPLLATLCSLSCLAAASRASACPCAIMPPCACAPTCTPRPQLTPLGPAPVLVLSAQNTPVWIFENTPWGPPSNFSLTPENIEYVKRAQSGELRIIGGPDYNGGRLGGRFVSFHEPA